MGGFGHFVRFVTGTATGFSDPARLTRWTRGFLYAFLVALLSEWSARALMITVGPIQQSEVAGVVWLAPKGFLLLGIMLLLSAWTHRANHNARQLGASTLRFAPEWAAGWYFLPPGLFWKPYQVMQEIWKASVQPQDWRSQPGSPLVGWWWAMWSLGAWGVALAETVTALAMEPGDAPALYGAIGAVRTILYLSATLVLLTIIARVHRMQMAHYGESIRSDGQTA